MEEDYKELDELEQLDAMGELDTTPAQTDTQNVKQKKEDVNDYEDALNQLLG